MNQSIQYLKKLDPQAERFLFACYDYRKIEKAKQIYSTFDAAKAKLTEFNDSVFCVYVTVNETDGPIRKKENIKRARAIWVEDDEKRDGIRTDFPLEPSLIVESSPQKYHYYWFTSTQKLNEWDDVMLTMVVEWGCDNKAKDRARVLRLPGFIHRKDTNKPFVCRIVKDSGKVYKWFEIKSVFKPQNQKEISIDKESKEKEKKKKLEHNPPTSYSEEASIKALLSSENYHGSLTSIAMAMSNKNMSREMQYFTLFGLMHKIPPEKRRPEWEARVSEEHLYECIDSGIKKKQEEDEQFGINELRTKEYLEIGMHLQKSNVEFPPGKIGELCEEILDMAPYPNREIALSGAMGLVAGIIGRTYNVIGMGLNLYIAILADSGIGKANLKDSINLALRAGGGKFNLGHSFVGRSRFTGPKAIFDMLAGGLSRVCIIEESGLIAESKAGDGAGITRALLDLYTSCGYGKWAGDEGYSDKNNNIPALHSPALSIVNVSTPKSFLRALKSKSADVSGEVARLWMMRQTGEKPYLNRNRRTDFSPKQLAILGKLITTCIQFQKAEDELQVIRLSISDEILNRCDYWVDLENRFIREQDHLRRTLCSRAFAKIVKMAGVCSVYNGKDHIGKEEYEWAEKTIKGELESIKNAFTHEVTDDLQIITKNVVVPAVVQSLLGLYQNPDYNTPEQVAQIGIFGHYNIYQALRNNNHLKEIDDDVTRNNPSTGLDKCLRHMIKAGLITYVDDEIKAKFKIKSKVCYRITSDFKNFYLEKETIKELQKASKIYD